MAINESVLINAAIQTNLVSTNKLLDYKQQARRERKDLLDVISFDNRMPVSAFYQALAEYRKIPFLQVHELVPAINILEKIPANTVQRRIILPVYKNSELFIVMADPDDNVALDSISRLLTQRQKLKVAFAEPAGLKMIIARYYRQKIIFSEKVQEEPDYVEIFNILVREAHLRRSSDIHMEPEKEFMRIRFRVDGHLQEYSRGLNKEDSEGLVNRIKVLANLDIAEQRMPQDGGITFKVDGWDIDDIDMRIATVPTRWGERVTVRLLAGNDEGMQLDNLGMPTQLLSEFKELVRRKFGIVLVTGPTGGGKSTTLYAALRQLDTSSQNILTVEDPIEQFLNGVSQVQVSTKVSFASALRSFLRHDPDVVLVGEIRDKETAEIALKAAMTGHLVMSTLHTNTSIAAVNRLIDIGCERFLIASSLIGVVAQRLIRRLCIHCKVAAEVTEDDLLKLEVVEPSATVNLFKAQGCPHCLGTGYLGRVGVYELFGVDDSVVHLIEQGANEAELKNKANVYYSLWQDGRSKVLEGITSLDEALQLKPKV